MTVLALRAFDSIGSDQHAWELRREVSGFQWWTWPSLSEEADWADWERVRGIPLARTAGQAEEWAREWFRKNEPHLTVEILAGCTTMS